MRLRPSDNSVLRSEVREGHAVGVLKLISGDRDMAQQWQALAALAEDLDFVPSTHTGLFTYICNSVLRKLIPFFWLLRQRHSCGAQIVKQTHKYT